MSDVAKDLLKSMEQALAHARGDADAPVTVHQVAVEDVDTKAIRMQLGFTQNQMAMIMGTSVSGLRKWEQGKRRPGGAARTLMLIMQKEPEAVKRALAG